MKKSELRIPIIVVLLAGIVYISGYGFLNPPVREPFLPELKEYDVARFQYFPLRVVSILNDGVILQDRKGDKLTCVPIPSMSAHPAIQLIRKIDAKIIIRNGKCFIAESVDGSGYRLYKIIISLISLLLVLTYFLRYYTFHQDLFHFDKRKKNA